MLHAHTSYAAFFRLTIFGRMPGRPVTVDVYNNFIWRSKTVASLLGITYDGRYLDPAHAVSYDNFNDHDIQSVLILTAVPTILVA